MATIGIDAGTSGCKAVLLSDNGAVLQTAWAGYPTRRALDGDTSQDAEDWVRAVIATARACAQAATETVDAVSITSPAHNVVLVGRDDRPVRRVMLWSDPRPAGLAEQIRAEGGAALFERTLVHLTAGWSLPQLAWLRQHEPEVHARITMVLPGKDYLRFRLTGEFATDHTDAAGTALYDARRGDWGPDLIERAGLRMEQVPPIRPSHALGGGLSRPMARRLGLPRGTPVAIGATDTAAELVAAGVDRPGDGLVKIASTGTVVAISDAPRPHPSLLTYPHAVEGRWYSLAATSAAATSYGWLREIVYAEAQRPPDQVYREMGRLASRVPAGSAGVLFLPFLQGERTPYWDPQLRGAFLGLSAAHGRDHLFRAVLEGVAMSLRMCRDEILSAGFALRRVRLAGGGTASPLWCQIVASTLHCIARTASTAGPAAGAAAIAAWSIHGVTAAKLAHDFATVRPRQEWVERYDDLYEVYREAAAILTPISHRLSATARSTDR